MADTAAESSGDTQLTFKVKTSGDKLHTVTMPETATVLELKTKLSGAEFEDIPVDRQRLIYSGRVMKNDDALSVYSIKPNNTIHMVKSAASNAPRNASSASSAAPTVPTNMASGTANNPLAGLTGARYAGHQVPMPGMDMFGPDGGMTPMDPERMERMMSDPNVQQTMNEALNNPDFVNMLIDSNPMLRNIPNIRELISSPMMRNMMTNPQAMASAMRMQRGMGGAGAFPAPGATDGSTTEGAPAAAETDTGAGGAQGAPNMSANPFAALFPGAGGAGAGLGGFPNFGAATGAGSGPESGAGTPGNPNDPMGLEQLQGNVDQLQNMLNFMRGGMAGAVPGASTAPAAPADTRPPEEQYAEQLRQLNDMGFFDFDRNVAALRRSGGSVQGAIEHLLL